MWWYSRPCSSGEGRGRVIWLENIWPVESKGGAWITDWDPGWQEWGVSWDYWPWEANVAWALCASGLLCSQRKLTLSRWDVNPFVLMHWLPAETRSPRWGREKVRSFQSPGPHVKGSSCSRPRGLLEVRYDSGGGGVIPLVGNSSEGHGLLKCWQTQLL